MPRVLLTAYAPYDDWPANASWIALQQLTRDLPDHLDVVTRLYPVDFTEMATRLELDLSSDIDVVLHLGQAPGAARIQLEAIGLNCARERTQRAEEAWPLVPGGPVAYCSTLPLAKWARMLRDQGIPAEVSHHAGVYLCNAVLYLTHHLAAERGFGLQAAFLHLPLDTSQVIDSTQQLASQPAEVTASGLRLLLDDIAACVPAR